MFYSITSMNPYSFTYLAGVDGTTKSSDLHASVYVKNSRFVAARARSGRLCGANPALHAVRRRAENAASFEFPQACACMRPRFSISAPILASLKSQPPSSCTAESDGGSVVAGPALHHSRTRSFCFSRHRSSSTSLSRYCCCLSEFSAASRNWSARSSAETGSGRAAPRFVRSKNRASTAAATVTLALWTPTSAESRSCACPCAASAAHRSFSTGSRRPSMIFPKNSAPWVRTGAVTS